MKDYRRIAARKTLLLLPSRPGKNPHGQDDSEDFHATSGKNRENRCTDKQKPMKPIQGPPNIADERSRQANDSQGSQASSFMISKIVP